MGKFKKPLDMLPNPLRGKGLTYEQKNVRYIPQPPPGEGADLMTFQLRN